MALKYLEIQPKSNVINNIFILLHGFGVTGKNLIPLGHILQKQIDNTYIALPHTVGAKLAMSRRELGI